MIESRIGVDQVLYHPSRSIGLYLVQLTDGERSFSYWRDNSAARELIEDPGRIRKGVVAADVLFFSGITSAILCENQREALHTILAEASKNGAQVVFDPNLRPKLWTDENLMCDSIMQAAAVSSIVLPSFEDEAEYFGDASPLATCQRYVNAGCGTVIVKNGPGEIFYSLNGEVGTFQPDRVDTVLDSTAAGDSFNAGFLSEFLSTGDIRQALRCASGLAGRVIQGRGALVQSAIESN